MTIRKAVAAVSLAAAVVGGGAAVQTMTAGDANAAGRVYQGNGKYLVGPFSSVSKCTSHRAANARTYNLSRTNCFMGAPGQFYYTGRAGA